MLAVLSFVLLDFVLCVCVPKDKVESLRKFLSGAQSLLMFGFISQLALPTEAEITGRLPCPPPPQRDFIWVYGFLGI